MEKKACIFGPDCISSQVRPLETFESLDYVNIKFNQKFSPRRRYNVPHIPMMVDKAIMIGLESSISETIKELSKNTRKLGKRAAISFSS